jgi:hypothetical protein
MNERDTTLRERLLNMETPNTTQQGTHRERVKALLDTRLDVVKRIGFALLALVGLWATVAFGKPAWMAARDWEEAFVYRMFTIFAFFVSVAWTVLTGWAAVSGVVRRTHRPWIVALSLAMGFCYVVTLMFMFVVPISLEESRSTLGTQFALIGFFLLNTIGLCAILGVLYRGQFKSQEKLLEIEYNLADLAEKIEKRAH